MNNFKAQVCAYKLLFLFRLFILTLWFSNFRVHKNYSAWQMYQTMYKSL